MYLRNKKFIYIYTPSSESRGKILQDKLLEVEILLLYLCVQICYYICTKMYIHLKMKSNSLTLRIWSIFLTENDMR